MTTWPGNGADEHPENDLTSDLRSDADYANLRPPEPHSFDELADAPDPLTIAAANRSSTKQAIWFMVGTIAASWVVALVLRLIFAIQDPGECVSAEIAGWLCTTQQRTIYAIGTVILPFAGMIANGVIMVRKLKHYVRWRPWMGTFWVLIFNFMLWCISDIQILLAPTH
ncbi:hypothetical protein [Corynebacterium sp.]|uniref:hypothetical protein n=1 Tax=Corynebacterium sp. TaxID=1720 RepID=UPI0026DBB66B|nr:hypothetical protein [Corynebacterium sp.]MDO5033160.1 hypothetical protein [Corynebacterium sp.]